ncbi:MAG: glycosyltransferase [Candidatus Saccharimonas sp.]|nr:glycosyltransferase [Planctomycetaceae bacterium]
MLAISFTWLAVLPWIIVVQWLIQLGMLLNGIRNRQILRASIPVPPRDTVPRLTVLVAARNEEDCIETCLRSLARQDHPNFEIIAINDRSSDGTANIMDRLAKEFPGRLRVVHIHSLPAGWFGKAHALQVGMQSATGDWVCFSDADCEQLSNHTLSLATHEALERGVDLLTLTPQFTMKSVWEKITVPVCSWLMMVWFQPTRVNNPRLRTSYANGAFMLMTRACYDSVGGWSQFRARISEDVAFARAAKSTGSRLVVLQNEGLYRARMYDSIRDSWNGWSRIFYGTLPKTALVLSTIRLVACSILPTWGLLLAIADWWLTPSEAAFPWDAALVGWMAVVVVQQIHAALTFRVVGTHVAWSLTAPIGHVILLGMLIRVLLGHLGLTTMQWSGAIFYRGRITQPVLIPVSTRS